MITFCKAHIDDALRISILLKTTYIHTYAEEGVSFEFANFLSKRFSVEHIENTIKQNPEQLIIAYKNNNPIGVIEIIFNKPFALNKIASVEINKLYVLERFHGIGIGYRLINEAENLIREKGYKQIWLEVYCKNQKAISFYQRQGYFLQGQVNYQMEVNTYVHEIMLKKI